MPPPSLLHARISALASNSPLLDGLKTLNQSLEYSPAAERSPSILPDTDRSTGIMAESGSTIVQGTIQEKQTTTSTQSVRDASNSPLVDSSENAEAATSKSDNLGDMDYSSGVSLFFIVLALILSIFLASLDLVCLTKCAPVV